MLVRFFALASLGLASCSAPRVDAKSTRPIDKAGAIRVEFEFDKIDLAETIRRELRVQGYSVAAGAEPARYVWTGEYSADHDVIHNRFNWARFRIIDAATGETECQIQIDQGGLTSVESGIARMVQRLDGSVPPAPPPRPLPGED